MKWGKTSSAALAASDAVPRIALTDANTSLDSSRAPTTSLSPTRSLVILVYKNGDEYFPGIAVNVAQRMFKSMPGFLASLAERLDMPWGVRRLYACPSGDRVRKLAHLINGGLYVAAGNKAYKHVEYPMPSPLDDSASFELDDDTIVMPERLRPATPDREWRNTSTYRRRARE